MARAIAAKKAQQALEEMDRLAARRGEEDKKFENGAKYSNTGSHYKVFKKSDNLSDDEARAAGVRTKEQRKRTDNSITAMYQAQYTGGSRTYYDKLTDEEVRKVNEYRQKMARAQAAAYKAQEDQQVKAITERYKAAVTEEMKQQQKLYNLSEHPKTSTGGGSSKSEKKEAPEKGSLEDLEAQRKKLVDIQQKGTFKKHKTNADDVAAEIAKLDQQIENQKFVLDFNTDPAKVDLDVLERQYNKMYADLRNKKLEGPDLQKAEQNLKRLNQYIVDRKYSMNLDIKPAEDSLIQLQRKSDEIFSKMRSPEITGTADFTSLKQQYDDLQKQITGKKAELQIDTKAAEGSVSDLQQKIVALLGQQNDLKLNLDTDDAKKKVQELDGQIEELYKQMGAQAAPLTLSTEAAHQSLQAMQAKLSAMQNAVSVDVTLDDDALVKMVKEINNLQKEIKNRKITLGLETDPSIKELENLGKRAQEAMQPKKQSSFQKAVGPKPVAKNDYDAQLSELQKVMDELDNQISKLEDVKKAYEELGETSSESYQKVIDKIGELNAAQEENASKAKDINKQNKAVKKSEKNWEHAADAVGNFGSAMSSIGSATDSPELNVAGDIAQSIAEITLGASKAIAQGSELGPFGWIAFAALAMAQLAAMISQVHSLTSHAQGGFIPGNSYSGDRRLARVNSGELVLNSSQQMRLWNLANGRGSVDGNTLAEGGTVEFVLQGNALRGVLKNTNRGLKRAGRKTNI